MKAAIWTDSEIDAAITLYLSMAVLAFNRMDYNKAAMIREVTGRIDKHHVCNAPLMLRSKGSVEMKLMNICAAVEALGRKDLSMAEHGFRPLVNIQKKLKDAVAARIKGVYVAIAVHKQDQFGTDAKTGQPTLLGV